MKQNRYYLRIRRENLIYLLLTFLLIVSGYIFLRYTYHVTDRLPFTQEIVLVLLGTIITIFITALLLNKQTEVELKKEENIKFLELKTDIYTQLLNHIEDVMLKGELERQDFIKLQFLTHKLALVSSPQVLVQYASFVDTFAATTRDMTLDRQESDTVSRALARLTIEIRRDIVGELDDTSLFTQQQISDQIMSNTNELIKAGGSPGSRENR